jgi:hypothetical protein
MARKSKDGLKRKSSSDSIKDNETSEIVSDDSLIKDKNIIENEEKIEQNENIAVSESVTDTEGMKSPTSSKLPSNDNPSSSSKKYNNEDKHIDLDSWLNEKESSFVNLTYPNPSCIFFTRTVVESICNGSMTEKEIRQSVTNICNDIGVKSTGRGTVAGLSLEVSTICGILNGIGIFEVDDKNHSILQSTSELSEYRRTSILSKLLLKYLQQKETDKLDSNISDLPMINDNEMEIDEDNNNIVVSSNISSSIKPNYSSLDTDTNTDINIENTDVIISNCDNITTITNNSASINDTNESTELDDSMDIGCGVDISPNSNKQESGVNNSTNSNKQENNNINSDLFDTSDSRISSPISFSTVVDNMTNSDPIKEDKIEELVIDTVVNTTTDSESNETNKGPSSRVLEGSDFVENEVRFFQKGIGGDLLRAITNDWKYQLPKYFDDSKRSFKKHKAILAAKALNLSNNPVNGETLDANGLIESKPPVKRTKIVYTKEGVAVIKTITSRRKKGELKKFKEIQKLSLQNSSSNNMYASLEPIVPSSTNTEINVNTIESDISAPITPVHMNNSIINSNPIVESSQASNELQISSDIPLQLPDAVITVDNNIIYDSLQVESIFSSNITKNTESIDVGDNNDEIVLTNNSLQVNTNLPIDEEDNGNNDSDNSDDDGSDDEKDELYDELDDEIDNDDGDDDDHKDYEDDGIEMDDDDNVIINNNNDNNKILDKDNANDSENINNSNNCNFDKDNIKIENINKELIDQTLLNYDASNGDINSLDNGMEIIDVKETNENASITSPIVANDVIVTNNSSIPTFNSISLPTVSSTLNLPLNFDPQSIESSNMIKLEKNQNVKLSSERRRRASNQRAWRLEEDVVKSLLTDPVTLLTNWGKACYDEANSQEEEEILLRKIASQCGIQVPSESFRKGTRYLVEDNAGKEAVPTQVNIVKKEFNQSKPLREGGILTAASLIQRANKKFRKQCNSHSSFGYNNGVMITTAPKIAPPLYLHQEMHELTCPIVEDSLYASNSFPVSNKSQGPITVTNVLPDLCIRTSEIPWKMVANEFILLNADELDILLPQSPRDPTPHSTRTRLLRTNSNVENPINRSESNVSNKIRKRRFSDLDLSSSLTPSTSNRVIGTGSNGGYGLGLGLGLKKSTSFEISAPQFRVVTKMTKNIYEEMIANGGEDSGEEEDLSDEAVLQRHEDVLKVMRDKWASLVKLKKEMRELNNPSSSSNSLASLASTTSLPHFAQMKVNAEAAANGLGPASVNHALNNIKSRRRSKSKSKRGRPRKILSRVYSNDSQDIIQDNTEDMDCLDNDDNEEEIDGENDFSNEIDINDDDNNIKKKNSNSSNSIASNDKIIAPTTELSLSNTKDLSISNNQEQLKRCNSNNKLKIPNVLSPEIVNNSEIEAVVATRSSPRTSKTTSDTSVSIESNNRDTRKRNRNELAPVQEQVVLKSRYFREKEAREAREKALPDNLRKSPRDRVQREKSP